MTLTTQLETCRRCNFAYVTTGRIGLCGRCYAETKNTQPCIVCGEPAEPSTVGTPTCSLECLGVLNDRGLPVIPPGGYLPVQPPKPFRWPRGGGDKVSVERALENLGSSADVLKRHGVDVRRRFALCPFHAERTPSFSLYERGGIHRAKCHGCGWSGGVIDLEAALSDTDNKTVIREWS